MVALIADELLPADLLSNKPSNKHSNSTANRSCASRSELGSLHDLNFEAIDVDLEFDTVESAPEVMTFGDDVPRPVLSLLPTMANTRETPRRKVALKAWLMTLEGATRGYALDLSEHGARLGGMGTHHDVGSTLLAKICLEPHESPVVVRCEVVRYSAPAGRTLATEISVRFVDVNLDEWFRLARFLDKEAKAQARGEGTVKVAA